MHEYHIIERAVKEVLEKAKESGKTKINKVVLSAGERSGLEEGMIKLHFELIAEGTPAEGAEISVSYVPADRSSSLVVDLVE